MTTLYTFCPRCGSRLAPRVEDARTRAVCEQPGCGFRHYDNPTPVVAAIVELPEGVVLARGRGWPEKMFALPTGFLEAGEDPAAAVVREVHEELGLSARVVGLVGLYPFAAQNQLLIAYHLSAAGPVVLGDELEAHRIVPVSKLRGWPFATGLAVMDWLARRPVSTPP